LRKELVLKNNVAQYKFVFDQTDTGANKNLRRQDVFVVTSWGLFLTREAQTAKGTGVLQTYVNTTFFLAVAGPSAFTPDHLQTIYNGYLDTTTDKNKVYENYQTDRFQRIPQTQQSVTNAKSQRDPNDGYVDTDPLLFLNGERKNDIALNIPTFSGIAIESQTSGTDNLVVMIPRGFLLSNYSQQAIYLEDIVGK
jgi:hypothetical protein